MSAWTAVHRMAKPPERLVRLVLESDDGTALVPIPERSTSPRATSTLYRWGSLIALDPNRPIREADIVALFDHLVGTSEQCWRNCQAERLRGLEVQKQLNFHSLLDRQVTRLFALTTRAT